MKSRKEYLKTYRIANRVKLQLYKTKWKKNNPEKIKNYGKTQIQRSRIWKKDNPEYSKQYYLKNGKRDYNRRKEREIKDLEFKNKNSFATKRRNLKIKLSYEEYKKMFINQQNVCAICYKPETSIHYKSGQKSVLSIDHCHKTNKVRGLLCRKCNTALGMFLDEPKLVLRAYNYLIKSL